MVDIASSRRESPVEGGCEASSGSDFIYLGINIDGEEKKVYEQVEDMQYEIQTNNFSLDYENSSVDTHQCPDVRQIIESKKSHSQIIKDSLSSIWETVCNICCSVHDYLGLPHSKNSAEKLEFSSLMEIKKTVNDIYTRLHNLISCLQKTLAAPLNSFSEDIDEIKGLYFALISFNSEENIEDLLSPELVYKFCNLPKHRRTLKLAVEQFEEFRIMILEAVDHLKTKVE
ncbi:unnamed protein product [Timema podura]|uniref:Uncharacterized protein n=1 Tax=Timema podura TaxID=61482 RepID=A0ABN7NQK4_TIMPD|nr:unnamed protein product [Timema podura]